MLYCVAFVALLLLVTPRTATADCTVTLHPDFCDQDGYAGTADLVVSNNCMVVSGAPGIFDDDPSAGCVPSSPVQTCPDYGKPGVFCIAEPTPAATTDYGWRWDCTDPTSKTYGSFAQCPKSGGIYGQPRCVATTATDPGKCNTVGSNRGTAAGVAAAMQQGPCTYFNTAMQTIPAGSTRAFCIGATSDTVLVCPGNIVKRCQNKCLSKFDDDAKTMPCGKAACDTQGYYQGQQGYARR